MNHRLGASFVYLAAALLAGCAGPSAAQPAAMDLFPASRPYSAMGADSSLAAAMNAVQQSCPLRMADALTAAVKELDVAPERGGRPPVALDAPDPQSFIGLYNRIAAEEPRIDRQILLRHTVEGMTKALDPESQASGYMNLPSMTGPFAGIGLELKSEAGRIIVVDTIPDSPASRGDMKAGDRVMAVDATNVTGLSLEEVVEKLRGEKDSSVELTIGRDGRAGDFKVTLTREIVKLARVKPQMQGRIAVITLPAFDERASKGLSDAIREALQAGAAAYVIDIRKNGGGLLDQIIESASLFLEGGRVLSTAPPAECGSTDRREDYNAWRGFKLKDSPVIVLIGKGTGSGAELFAAAMSERGRARLVGQTTAGMGVVHTVIPLGNSAAMRLKTSELLTSQGARITGVGVKPTIEIPESEDALARALQLLATP
jgi:carboxyl-terminal processing protease